MKMLKSILAIGLVLAWGSTALAGDYHSGGTLICSDCHIMHASQTHGYNPDGTDPYPAYDTANAHESLLRYSVTDLCLSCHDDGGGAADVMFNNTNNDDIRAAGALNMPGSGLEATGHTMGSGAVAPGGTWLAPGAGFNCTDCHQQHGYNPNGDGNAYRNLHYSPGGQLVYPGMIVTYATGTNDGTKDIFQTTTAEADHYEWNNVAFNEPNITESAYADFCQACHTHFHGIRGGGDMGGASGIDWIRHPNAHVEIGGNTTGGYSSMATFSDHDNNVKVMSASGSWDDDLATDLTPSCMSCHKAHGNQNAFGLIFMTGTGTVTEEGDNILAGATDLCGQCHVQ